MKNKSNPNGRPAHRVYCVQLPPDLVRDLRVYCAQNELKANVFVAGVLKKAINLK